MDSSQINLPAEVLGVLRREGELNVHEIARAVYADTGYHAESDEIANAVFRLTEMGHSMNTHYGANGISYELEES